MGDFTPLSPVVYIARCPECGLHGERSSCFECGGEVEQVAMVPVEEVEALRDAGPGYHVSPDVDVLPEDAPTPAGLPNASGVVALREELAAAKEELAHTKEQVVREVSARGHWRKRYEGEVAARQAAEERVAVTEDALRALHERIRQMFLDRPVQTDSRDTFADGYTNGIVTALQMVGEALTRVAESTSEAAPAPACDEVFVPADAYGRS